MDLAPPQLSFLLPPSSSFFSPQIQTFSERRSAVSEKRSEESNGEGSEKTASEGTLEIDISEKESLLQDENQSFDMNMNMVGIFDATGPIQRPSRRTQFRDRQLEK
jgi:hypothetical protein